MEQMQRVNSQSQSNLLSSILENDVEIIQKIIDAHMMHCDFTAAKFRPLFEKARENPQYVDCPAHMVSLLKKVLLLLVEKYECVIIHVLLCG